MALMNERRGGTGWIRSFGEWTAHVGAGMAVFGDFGIAAESHPIFPLTANGPLLALALGAAGGLVGIAIWELGKRAEFGFLEG